MRMRWILSMLLAVSLTACEDDYPSPCACPEGGPWTEVDLAVTVADEVRLVAVDCGGVDCLALGFSVQAGTRTDSFPGVSPLFYALDPDDGWVPTSIPGLAAENYTDLALDGFGHPVVAGWGTTGGSQPYSTIHDARTEPPTTVGSSASGLFTVSGDEGFFVAGGMQGTALMVSSTAPGIWTDDTILESGTNEGGFHDVFVHGEVAVACGFDDGADTLQVVLRRTKSDDWKLINRNGLPFATELRSIAVDASGAIYVGGVQSPGGPGTQAFASVRSPDGEWTSLALPDPVALGRVNDILLASDGSIYLACSSEYDDTSTAHLAHVTASGIEEEISPFGGELLQLAEAADGTIYAVGSRRIGSSTAREPVLFQRAP